MNSLLEITQKDFESSVSIKINNVLEGFNIYKNIILSPISRSIKDIENDYTKLIKDLYYLNDKNLIIDFYLSKLDDEEYKNLYNELDYGDKLILEDIKNSKPCSNYFLVKDESIIEFLVRLSVKEIFFVSFYFIKYPLTIWGNYNYKFPLFYEKEIDDLKDKNIFNNFNI